MQGMYVGLGRGLQFHVHQANHVSGLVPTSHLQKINSELMWAKQLYAQNPQWPVRASCWGIMGSQLVPAKGQIPDPGTIMIWQAVLHSADRSCFAITALSCNHHKSSTCGVPASASHFSSAVPASNTAAPDSGRHPAWRGGDCRAHPQDPQRQARGREPPVVRRPAVLCASWCWGVGRVRLAASVFDVCMHCVRPCN